ncbi:hypothetical protein J7T55_007689 [Diaporthe amygdali]|uniref:uncharacterized protein n=1 Tax=Phomopsis amygdali TaxID=1214568 RepID=UPI0022FECA71|nr:uncharacterized protein J7T55_007689 [Diaporthe amygdali]KAJ0107500.1 hypothetical protein J7T55_007689 [Diaporthe amygdali]
MELTARLPLMNLKMLRFLVMKPASGVNTPMPSRNAEKLRGDVRCETRQATMRHRCRAPRCACYNKRFPLATKSSLDDFSLQSFISSAEAWAEELQRALSAQEESINSRIYMRQLMRLNRSYISELPDELLVKIFFEVATESPRHLLSIVKTCKAFHDMAIPLLYSSLELLSGRSREYMQSLGMSFRRHPQRRGYAIEAKLRGSPETFRSLGQIPVIFSPDAFPNIKRLHGIRVDVSSLQNILTADEPSTGTSTIEELIFEESEIRIWPAGLDALLSACRIVRKLVLHWGCGAAESPRNGEFLQEAMGLAIARHAATLETLKLMPNEAQISTDSQSEPGSLKDRLPSFSVLKDLTIHMVCFDGGGQTQFTLNMGATAQLGLVNFLPPNAYQPAARLSERDRKKQLQTF